MNFLNPFALLFLPLSLLPIFLHLILKRRKKTIYFPWLFFFKEKEELKKRRKIVEIIILVLRILIILFIILSFAKPYLSSKFGIPEVILYNPHPFVEKKIKNLKYKFLPLSKMDSIYNSKVKDIYIFGPVPYKYLDDIFSIEKKKVYFIEPELENISILNIKQTGDKIELIIFSSYNEPLKISIEIYSNELLILREELELKKGINKKSFVRDILKNEKILFFKLDLKEEYEDDNFYYFYLKESPTTNIILKGKDNRFLKAFKKVLKGKGEKIYVFSGIKGNEREIKKLFYKREKILVFCDTITEDFILFLREIKGDLKEKLSNFEIKKENIKFKKFFIFKGGKTPKIYFNVPFITIYKNLALFGFEPSPHNTDFVYNPLFFLILKDFLYYFSEPYKIKTYKGEILEIELEEGLYELYTVWGDKLKEYNIKPGERIYIDFPPGIYHIKGKEKFIIEVNSPPLFDFVDIKELKGKENFIIVDEINHLRTKTLKKTFTLIALLLLFTEFLICLIF